MGKSRFDKWLWGHAVAKVSYYHGNNGIFTASYYQHDCDKRGQAHSFSGSGAQHQNARSGRSIQKFMYMDRTFMVHASFHWSERFSDDISLWYF